MKRQSLLRVVACLALLLPVGLAHAQGDLTESLTVTNSPTNITVHNTVSYVMVRENSATPSALFSITPTGQAAVNLAAGQCYRFSGGAHPNPAGTTIGTIQATTSGPFTFVLLESNSDNGSCAAGAGTSTATISGTVQTQPTGNSSVLSGVQAVTASAVALPTNSTRNVCVKALIGNAINVYVGPSGITTATGMELAPGDGYCTPVNNSNLLYVIASTTGASVSWIATN